MKKAIVGILLLAIPVMVIIQGCKKDEDTNITVSELTTLSATEITSTSAISGGNITDDGGAPVSARGVVWSKTENPDLSTNEGKTEDGSGDGEYASHLTELSPGTMYYIKAFAINSKGTSYGAQVTFTTSVELAGITTMEPYDVTSVSAKSGGNVTEDGGSEILEKGIVWGTSENPNLENHQGKNTHGTDTGEFSSNITELEPATEYFVRAYAQNSKGTAYGNQVSFTTHTAMAKVTTSEISDITSDYAFSGGNITSDGGTTVTVRGVVWSTLENPSVDNNTGITIDGDGMGEFTSKITDLMPETQYFVKAYATNNNGTAYGDQLTFTTTQVVQLPTVITETITAITHNSAVGGGNVTESGGATVTDRGIVYSTTPDPSFTDSVVTSRRGLGSFIAQMTGLEPLTTYYVKAYAINTAGVSFGEQVEFATQSEFGQPCPGIPTITDSDGNVYNTVLIGEQCWFKEDLKTTKYRNNTAIFHAPDSEDWTNNKTGAYVWYDNDAGHAANYGAIYNWYAVKTEQLCPAGWWIPSEQDWLELSNYMIDNFENITSANEGNMMKSCRQIDSPLGGNCNTTEHPRWDAHESHFGTDMFGFTAVPGGSRNWTGTYFHGYGIIGYWWASTEVDEGIARYRRIYHNDGILLQHQYSKNNGYNVRCMRRK